MSDGPRLPLDLARDAAAKLLERWGLAGDPGVLVAGSIRRERPLVGDIDLVAPLPAAGATDALCAAIAATCRGGPAGEGLFPAGPEAFGIVTKGLHAGFHYCQVLVKFGGRAGGVRLPVEVHRYTPGAQGNRGWIEVLRTGPREFGIGVLQAWARRAGVPGDGKASDRGFLRDALGRAVPTPAERDVFNAAGLMWVEPRERTDKSLMRVA